MLLKVLICNGLSINNDIEKGTGIYTTTDVAGSCRDVLKILFLIGAEKNLRNNQQIVLDANTAHEYGINASEVLFLCASLIGSVGFLCEDGTREKYPVISDVSYNDCGDNVTIISPYMHMLLCLTMAEGESLLGDVIKEIKEVINEGDYWNE